MKRTILLACAALALAACSKEENGGMTDGRTELRLAGGIEAVTRGDVQNTEIVAGETVYAWVSDAGTGQKLYNAGKLTAQTGGGLAGTTPMYFPQTGNAVNIRALHGTFNETFEAGQTAFPASVGFTVAADQSEAGGAAYKQSDLLYAASDNVARSGNPTTVSLKFYHLLSKLELKIVRGEGVTDAVTKVTLDGVAVGGTFTPTEGADLTQQTARAAMIAADAAQTATMTLGGAFWDEGTKTTNDAIVVPQAVGGKTMTFTLASGGELVYTIPSDKKFESGKKHVYTVTLKGTGLSVESTIEPWDGSDGETEGDATLPPPPPAKVGDYFYSDGTYSTALDPAKKVIGIVFQTDKSRIGQAEKDALAAKGIDRPHGLVMAVRNAADNVRWCTMNVKMDIPELPNTETVADCYNDVNGLYNTQTIWNLDTYAANSDNYPAFKVVANLNANTPAPEKTTGWFVPSTGQWWDILQNLGSVTALEGEIRFSNEVELSVEFEGDVCANLNQWLKGVTDADIFPATFNRLWTSLEFTTEDAANWVRIWYLHPESQPGGNISCYGYSKTIYNYVRPVLAF